MRLTESDHLFPAQMSSKRRFSEIRNQQSEAQDHFKLQKPSVLSTVSATYSNHLQDALSLPEFCQKYSDLCFVFSDGTEQIFPGFYLATLLSVAPGSVNKEGLNTDTKHWGEAMANIPVKVHTALTACEFRRILDFADRGMSGFENKTLSDAVTIILAFEKGRGDVSFISPLFRWIAHYIWKHCILHGISSKDQILSSWPMNELSENSRWNICSILNGCSR